MIKEVGIKALMFSTYLCTAKARHWSVTVYHKVGESCLCVCVRVLDCFHIRACTHTHLWITKMITFIKAWLKTQAARQMSINKYKVTIFNIITKAKQKIPKNLYQLYWMLNKPRNILAKLLYQSKCLFVCFFISVFNAK